MTKLYKLTDAKGYTRRGELNECPWGEGFSHSGTGEGELCGPGWIHAYTSPLLAVLLNPIHADLKNPRLWEARGKIAKTDHGLKVGCKTLTTVKEIPLPKISTTQRIAFGILCALEVHKEPGFAAWATAWLGGKDRSAASATRAASAARAAADAADAATRAASAARAAARAADAAYAARAAYAADAAAYAAAYAARAVKIDLIPPAQKAMAVK